MSVPTWPFSSVKFLEPKLQLMLYKSDYLLQGSSSKTSGSLCESGPISLAKGMADDKGGAVSEGAPAVVCNLTLFNMVSIPLIY